MAQGTCDKTDCTVAQTGICLLSNPDPNTCPHFKAEEGENPPQRISAPALPGKDSVRPIRRRFHGGLELGTDDAAELMRTRYTHLIAILGSWDAGKTCFLSSLYLTAAHGGLKPDYLFAGSRTLQGFEDRARRTRRWSGSVLPDRLSDHTTLSDPRSPALLHLALQETLAPSRRIELLLTDLPGEWSKNLVDRADTAERFRFLHRADGVLIVLDGPLLTSEARHSEYERSKLLVRRLAETVQLDRTVPILLVVSKCDKLGMREPPVIRDLQTYASSLGFQSEIVLTAAFSSTPETIENGAGILKSIRSIIDRPRASATGEKQETGVRGLRMFENFRE